MIGQKVYYHALQSDDGMHSVEFTDGGEKSMAKHAEYLELAEKASKFNVKVNAFISMVGYWSLGGRA